MGTIDKTIADRVIAGEFDSDKPLRIVKYTNNWGGESYGLVCKGERLDRYAASDFVHNPTIYWEKK